jgi:hypothetical protein
MLAKNINEKIILLCFANHLGRKISKPTETSLLYFSPIRVRGQRQPLISKTMPSNRTKQMAIRK